MMPVNIASARRQIGRLGSVALLGTLAILLAGCHSAEQAAPPPAATQAKQITDVQNNPKIPPEAKTHIVQQMQGQAPVPPKPTAAPPPP